MYYLKNWEAVRMKNEIEMFMKEGLLGNYHQSNDSPCNMYFLKTFCNNETKTVVVDHIQADQDSFINKNHL